MIHGTLDFHLVGQPLYIYGDVIQCLPTPCSFQHPRVGCISDLSTGGFSLSATLLGQMSTYIIFCKYTQNSYLLTLWRFCVSLTDIINIRAIFSQSFMIWYNILLPTQTIHYHWHDRLSFSTVYLNHLKLCTYYSPLNVEHMIGKSW